MKLSTKVTYRISVWLSVILLVWAAVFYLIVIDEIRDETDDALENRSEQIIRGVLNGEPLPLSNIGTNIGYNITPITADYAANNSAILYSDSMVYIVWRKEFEPARILQTIYRDSQEQYYQLTVAIPTIEKKDLLESILGSIAILYLVLILTIVIINWRVVKRGLKPIYTLLNQLDRIILDPSLIDRHASSFKTDELRKLYETFATNTKRVREGYRMQKHFIGNASHELQTPLATMLGRIELLLGDAQLTEYQLEELLKLKSSIMQMIRLNKTLLLLTKIENRQFEDNTRVDIDLLIDECLDELRPQFEHKEIDVQRVKGAKIEVLMSQTLARVLFLNLLTNAFLHNKKGGKVSVESKGRVVRISNGGEGEVALDEKLIFERFHRSAAVNSTGLGLALVQSICEIYHIKVSYTFSDGMHNFSLIL